MDISTLIHYVQIPGFSIRGRDDMSNSVLLVDMPLYFYDPFYLPLHHYPNSLPLTIYSRFDGVFHNSFLFTFMDRDIVTRHCFPGILYRGSYRCSVPQWERQYPLTALPSKYLLYV